MRKPVSAVLFALLAALGGLGSTAVPAAATATPVNPKVVIIVGATHGATSTYRTYANEVYAEAVKYTTNVVKVYSPNATWSKVQSAVTGASIVVYLGHGNGWPSPYTYDPNYTTKDGFGLNATSGNGDYNNKYYGEPAIRTLNFAPNAVVLLFHLCYASGNSEPGDAAPSRTVARQRVDNYAAAFIRAGARAVIADGHSHHPHYIRSLFTTRQTIDQLWRRAPNFHDHVFTFGSVRNPGYTVAMDPDTTTSGYYRSLAGKLTLRTEDVTGARYAATDVDPATFGVGGNASVSNVAGAQLYQDAGLATPANPATLPVDTRLRIVTEVAPAPVAGRAFQVTGIDDSTISGYVLAADLRPRDSTGPRVWEVDDGPAAFSPNGDGRQDSNPFTGRFSEPVSWTLTFTDAAGSEVAALTGTGTDRLATSWDGLADGAAVPDGTYAWRLSATDSWQNTPAVRTGHVAVDTVKPVLGVPLAGSGTTPTFSPNGDGQTESASLPFTTTEPGTVDATIRASDGTILRSITVATGGGSGSIAWDGRNGAGGVVPDGVYAVRMVARDVAGNFSSSLTVDVGVYTALTKVASSLPVFYPHDGDPLSPYTTLSFTLSRPATVTWQVVNAAGEVVKTRYANLALPVGTYSYRWPGTNDAGARLPRGLYRSTVRATDGTLAIRQATTVHMNAFGIRSTDSTPVRGQTVTVYATSAEPLSTVPLLRVAQPGISVWSVRMTHLSGRIYRATITLRASAQGQTTLWVSAYDTGARYQRTALILPLG